jgi:hypothetical protein
MTRAPGSRAIDAESCVDPLSTTTTSTVSPFRSNIASAASTQPPIASRSFTQGYTTETAGRAASSIGSGITSESGIGIGSRTIVLSVPERTPDPTSSASPHGSARAAVRGSATHPS